MSSPDSSWSIISSHEQEQDAVRQKQAAIIEQSSAANLTGRRLGTSLTHVQMENPLPPPPPLISNLPLASPGPVPIPNARRESRRREFPSVDPSGEKPEHRDEPPKGNAFVRRVRSSLLGGKNSFLSQNKSAEREKQEQIVIPPPLSPEPDAVIVRRPGSESNGTTPEPPVAPKGSRSRPPVTTYSTKLYSSQPAQPVQPSRSRRGSHSSTTQSQPVTPESVKTDRPPSRNKSRGSREVQIVVVSGRKTEDPPVEREPVLGAIQHRVASGKPAYPSSTSAPTQPPIRPLPPPPTVKPTVTLVPPSQPATAPRPIPAPAPNPNPIPTSNPVVATPVPQPTRPPPESLHPGAHYSDGHHHQLAHQSVPNPSISNPPVVRYKTSSDRTSYTTTATTPSLSSSVRTHASQPTSDVPPKGMERTQWASAPQSRPPVTAHTRAATVDASASDAWNSSLQQIYLRNGQQPGYHMEMSSRYESPPRTSPPSAQSQPPPKPKPNKLQRHATTAAPSTVVTHYYYDPSPPLITSVSRLSDLKEDYRNPGSERSTVIRRKINYLRFELGYTGLRRARGDGNCFYRSFAFCYLEQILFADDRAVAVVSALDYLEVAQNLLEAAIPNNKFARQMHLFLRDLIRNIELGKTDQKRLLRTFQDPRDSDDIVAYVRLLASAYIRLTPEMHASVFHPDDPGAVISTVDFCEYFVEEMNQDADHLQISALSRTLNVAVYIFRLDEKVDGVAPNDQDIPAHCTRFIPTEAPIVTEPIALLFRPGHYDILERHTEYA
ncbi:peptidase C65 Otubain-domain-containing protein [Rhizoctonia solani]|nr:peptidase C65 Otubain-domain-containing protein [Rhizoctonia solani]